MFAALFLQEHLSKLLPCLGRHPHQDEQLVDYLVHPFSWMLEQFIWNAIRTRCFPTVQVSRFLLKYARGLCVFKQ